MKIINLSDVSNKPTAVIFDSEKKGCGPSENGRIFGKNNDHYNGIISEIRLSADGHRSSGGASFKIVFRGLFCAIWFMDARQTL